MLTFFPINKVIINSAVNFFSSFSTIIKLVNEVKKIKEIILFNFLKLIQASSEEPTIHTTGVGERPGNSIPSLGHQPETRVNICIHRPPGWVYRTGKVQTLWVIDVHKMYEEIDDKVKPVYMDFNKDLPKGEHHKDEL